MKALRIAVPTGIGDSLWSLTLVESLLRQQQAESAAIRVCTTATPTILQRRAWKFLERFVFVSSVEGVDRPIHPQRTVREHDGFEYLPSGPLVGDPDLDYRLFVNGPLERGIRLENCFPDLEPNFSIMDRYCHDEPLRRVLDLTNGNDVIVVYLSNLDFYTKRIGGFNSPDASGKRWGLPDWVKTFAAIDAGCARPPCWVIVGADYDSSCAKIFMSMINKAPYATRVTNLCGETEMNETVQLLMRASLVMGYASGIPITSTYMRRPTIMMWNTQPLAGPVCFNEKFANAWVPHDMLASKSYVALRFGQHWSEDVAHEALCLLGHV